MVLPLVGLRESSAEVWPGKPNPGREIDVDWRCPRKEMPVRLRPAPVLYVFNVQLLGI